MAQGINIGVDEQGRDFLVYGNSVYRVDEYSPGGMPLGEWFSSLDSFMSHALSQGAVMLKAEAVAIVAGYK